jgi:GNAT superfamily N-acetyltransferase
MSEMDFNIIEAPIQSLDEFITLLDQVGEWLWHKGVKQWKPGVHRENRAEHARRVEQGCLILAYHQEKLAGGCILSELTPEAWPAAPDTLALYSLAAARFAAGKKLGAQILQYCSQVAARRGKARIRLDCWDGNDFLKSYYQRQGFKMLDAIQADGYYVRLFEKQTDL